MQTGNFRQFSYRANYITHHQNHIIGGGETIVGFILFVFLFIFYL